MVRKRRKCRFRAPFRNPFETESPKACFRAPHFARNTCFRTRFRTRKSGLSLSRRGATRTLAGEFESDGWTFADDVHARKECRVAGTKYNAYNRWLEENVVLLFFYSPVQNGFFYFWLLGFMGLCCACPLWSAWLQCVGHPVAGTPPLQCCPCIARCLCADIQRGGAARGPPQQHL